MTYASDGGDFSIALGGDCMLHAADVGAALGDPRKVLRVPGEIDTLGGLIRRRRR